MRNLRALRSVALIGVTCAFFGGVASASSFSYTGSFGTDDQIQEFLFSLSSTSTVTAVTYGYAGGTNQATATIAQGGFDPWLAIFNSAGALVASDDNGTCGQVGTDSNTGACFDAYISQSVAAGNYTLVLSQSDNSPFGGNLSDGYTRTGQTDFTSSFGCTNNQFCDINADNRTSNWAVDIDNVKSSSLPGTGAPEPATFLLLGGGFAGIFMLRRRFCAQFSALNPGSGA
jgi:hypothetical protein